MQIAIIGAGNVGRALATSLTRAGNDVSVSAPHDAHAREAAQQTGARPAPSTEEAVSAADLVILAVPATAHDELARDLGKALEGKVIIDVANRPTPAPEGPATSIAEELQDKLPAASVVKAFNTLLASFQANPRQSGVTLDGFVAGDDLSAKQKVLELVEGIGLRPVDAGPLAAARMLEGMAWLMMTRNMNGGTWQDAWVLVGPESVPALAASRN
jgi:predicted dinucleotide-binding enzyme